MGEPQALRGLVLIEVENHDVQDDIRVGADHGHQARAAPRTRRRTSAALRTSPQTDDAIRTRGQRSSQAATTEPMGALSILILGDAHDAALR